MLFLLASLLSLGYQETLYPEWKQTFAVEEVIYQETSDSADLAIFRNSRFGLVMALNGVIQFTENDEFIYHEMMAHVPLLSHGEAKAVLIIGGGNGGLLREVVKHPKLEKVVVVEPDPEAIVLSKKYFPKLAARAFEDSRVTLLIQDPARYMKETEEKFDLILSSEFYAECKSILNPNGIVVHPIGVPFVEKKGPFKQVQFFLASVPSRLGGSIAFSFASDRKYKPAEKVLKERLKEVQGTMRYYNPAIHRASFTLPEYLKSTRELGSPNISGST